ncbi:partitioning defective 3 homolog B-like [Osmerus eperlanus]|uniref:partitioning defective 3 homolog B-like n=1 Tax=Osmerus eperlanus TaxID=29151 RepID=UPI002E110104
MRLQSKSNVIALVWQTLVLSGLCGVQADAGVVSLQGGSPGLDRAGGARPEDPTSQLSHFPLNNITRTVEISGEHGPLGIHVVPYCSSLSGRALGLHIRGVEENSRSKREGIFQDEECIVKINDTDLMDKTFSQAQEVFRQAMRSTTMRLEVVPVPNRERYERSLIGQLFQPDSPRAPKTKEPPPIKAKPNFKPSESPALRLADDSSSLEGRPIGSPRQPVAHSERPE